MCNCNSNLQGIYNTNLWNINGVTSTSTCGHQQACNGCVDLIKSECVIYTGPNLTSLGINKNDDLNTVLSKLNDAKKAIDLRLAALETPPTP